MVMDMESAQLNLVMDMVMEVLPVVMVVMDMVDMANVQLNLHLLNMDMVKDQQSPAMDTEVDTALEVAEVDTASEAPEVDTMDRLCGFTR